MRVTKSVTVRGSRSPQIRPGGCYRITLAAYLESSLLITSTIPEYQVEQELCTLGVQDLAAISLDGRIPPGAEERGAHLSPGRILVDPAPGSASSEVNANQSSLSHHERELVSGSIVNTTERSLPQVC